MTVSRRKILLSEGSSLSSREAITALGLAGHRVELVPSDPMCFGRFSRFVTRVHRAPACGADPDGYLARVIETVTTSDIDVLLPVHEQAYLLAAARNQLPARRLVADIARRDAADASRGSRRRPHPARRDGIAGRDAAAQRRRDILREIGLLASSSGRYRGSREEMVPLLTDPWCAIPLAVVVSRLLRAPQAATRFSETTVAAYSLTPQAIHRLRAWHHAA